MTLRALALAAVAFVAAFATASPAQTPGRDSEANLIDELVVNGAPTGGPAWWTVSDSDSKVFILGIPSGLPKGLAWNTARTESRLKGANALILPPSVRANPIKLAAFFLFNRKPFQTRTPMEDTLPPALRARFVAARASVGKPADHYAKWKPGVAGMMLGGDFRKGLQITFKQPDDTIAALGDRARVPQRHVASYDIMPMLKTMAGLSEAAHEACLSDALTEIEAGR
ncbi:MAG TPA: TraB/GumN family protein, partial [Caulobacteraceae bacterium]